MISFIEINAVETEKIRRIWTQHAETFPPEERRNEEQFLKLWETPGAAVAGIFQSGEMVGYVVTWSLKNALFLEHFEIFPNHRNGNLGSEVLRQLLNLYPLIILETEPPHLSEMAARRLAFYERSGFQVMDERYLQPPYDAGKSGQPMWLMANNSMKNLPELRQEIYQKVYAISSPDGAAHF